MRRRGCICKQRKSTIQPEITKAAQLIGNNIQHKVGTMSHSFIDATPLEQSVFLLFMVLWIAYGILNQYNSIHGIEFDPTTVVWSQEVLKIILSFGLYLIQDGNLYMLGREVREHWTMLLWYLIPAGFFALGDVLTYINLRAFDPATLHLLGEMKLVVTAIVHQQLFHKMLNRWHWLALAIVTAGCILKALDSMELSSEDVHDEITNNATIINEEADGTGTAQNNHHPAPTLFNYGLIAIHILISTIAGVFNEKLLKDKPSICINLQNMCLYLDGIVFLSLGMLFGITDEHKSISEALSPSSLEELFSQPSILIMAVIMSVAGIVTSRFLKIFDSIRKSVAVALVVVSLPLLSQIFFHTPVTAKMIVSILMVLLGMHTYTSQPAPARVDGHPIEEDEEDESELFLPSIAIPGEHKIGDHGSNSHHTSVEMPKVRPRTPTAVV